MAGAAAEQPGRKCDREDALNVVRRLRESGHAAYFAGGCVRDLLLGRAPKDYDVATDAPPVRVRELFTRTQAVGAAFGVILVRLRNSQVEVATFRSDGAYLDGRRPSEVRFTTAEEDAKRRDFTINGLFLDPITDEVIDYVGGQADLSAKLVRAIGDPDRRFDEDHLRLLRAVRFASRFGFEIEPETAAAVRRHAPLLKRISPERIAEELRLMLCPPTRAAAWRGLWERGLLVEVFRFVPGVRDAEFSPGESVFLQLPHDMPVRFGLALAAGVVCLGWQAHRDARYYLIPKRIRQVVAAMRQGLKISNEEAQDLEGVLAGAALVLSDAPPATLARKKRFLARPTSRLARELLGAIRLATGERAEQVESLEAEFAGLERTDYSPPPFVTGDDLTAAGLHPGPMFKRVLDGVYDAQLEGQLAGREQAMELALRLASAG